MRTTRLWMLALVTSLSLAVGCSSDDNNNNSSKADSGEKDAGVDVVEPDADEKDAEIEKDADEKDVDEVDAEPDAPACVCGLQDSPVDVKTSAIHPDTKYSEIAGKACDKAATCAAGNPQLYLPEGISDTLFDGRKCLNEPGIDGFVSRLQGLMRRYLLDTYNATATDKAVLAMGNAAGWGFDTKHDEKVLCDSGYEAPPWAPVDVGFLQQGWGTNNDLYLAKMKVSDLVQILERQVGKQKDSDEAWPNTWGSWLVLSAPSSETRVVFNMCCTAQEYDEATQSIPTPGDRLVDLVIDGTRYTAADLDKEVAVIVTGYVGLQVPPAPEGARHYGFKNATFTQLTRSDLGLTGNPNEPLKEADVIDEWLASVASCLNGDDIANMDLTVGFASDESALVNDLCTE